MLNAFEFESSIWLGSNQFNIQNSVKQTTQLNQMLACVIMIRGSTDHIKCISPCLFRIEKQIFEQSQVYSL